MTHGQLIALYWIMGYISISFSIKAFINNSLRPWENVNVVAATALLIWICYVVWPEVVLLLQLPSEWCCRNCRWNWINNWKINGRNKWDHVLFLYLKVKLCMLSDYCLFSQVFSSSFRYSILCKAACTQLKTSSHSAITSKQCKIFSKSGSIQLEFYYIYFSFVLPRFGWTVHPLWVFWFRGWSTCGGHCCC